MAILEARSRGERLAGLLVGLIQHVLRDSGRKGPGRSRLGRPPGGREKLWRAATNMPVNGRRPLVAGGGGDAAREETG